MDRHSFASDTDPVLAKAGNSTLVFIMTALWGALVI
jgi:hypothetical protein